MALDARSWGSVPFNNALPLFILDGRNTTVFDDARKSPKSHDSFDEALSRRKDSGWRISRHTKCLENESSYETVSISDLMLGRNSKTLRRIMLVVVVVGVGQQLSGIDGVMGFMSFTLEEAA